jgi:N-acyl-D-amino-acid deacylase
MNTTEQFDLLIRGGAVIDGTRLPRFDADLGIRDGRIVVMGDLSDSTARKTIDATGRIVAPGFIDSHTHDDKAVLSDPRMISKVSQGVTTVITGNCGISLAPLRPDLSLPMPLSLVEPDEPPRPAAFGHFSDYLDALTHTPASVNVAAMVGHTTLRVMTMDDVGRAANEDEISAMRALLSEALDAGAIGISTGTAYLTASMAPKEEIIEVCRPLTGSGAVYVTHMRDEADRIVEALEETFAIGRELDVPVVVSHHKLMRAANFGRSAETLPLIRAAMDCQCVALDCYPYDASSTMLHADETRLQVRVRIAASVPHPELAGKDLADIATDWGVSRIEAARRLQPASAVYFGMDESDVRNILAFEETMIGSDGLPGSDQPHPRLWGTFPRVLGHYSRELGLFPLETAVWKMTGLTARNFGIADRGVLAVGNHADVVVFDPHAVKDRATYDEPTKPADGIDAVIVNGMLTWERKTHTGARGGQVITRAAGAASRSSRVVAS